MFLVVVLRNPSVFASLEPFSRCNMEDLKGCHRRISFTSFEFLPAGRNTTFFSDFFLRKLRVGELTTPKTHGSQLKIGWAPNKSSLPTSNHQFSGANC